MRKQKDLLSSDLEKLWQYTVEEAGFYDQLCAGLPSGNQLRILLFYETLRREHGFCLYFMLRQMNESLCYRYPDHIKQSGIRPLSETDEGNSGSIQKIYDNSVERTCEKYKNLLIKVPKQEYFTMWMLQSHLEEIGEIGRLACI